MTLALADSLAAACVIAAVLLSATRHGATRVALNVLHVVLASAVVAVLGHALRVPGLYAVAAAHVILKGGLATHLLTRMRSARNREPTTAGALHLAATLLIVGAVVRASSTAPTIVSCALAIAIVGVSTAATDGRRGQLIALLILDGGLLLAAAALVAKSWNGLALVGLYDLLVLGMLAVASHSGSVETSSVETSGFEGAR